MRLDLALLKKSLALSRTKANELINQNAVTINGKICTKPSQKVSESDTISVIPLKDFDGFQNVAKDKKITQFVARSAHKLHGILQSNDEPEIARKLQKKVKNAHCLDIGASTGGFTQVLLSFGAKSVVAVDVGHGQLSKILRADKRVLNLEGTNFRNVTWGDLGFTEPFDIVVCDVSFISLKYIIPKICEILSQSNRSCEVSIVLLVKPQFEVGNETLKKFSKGIINDPSLINDVVEDIMKFSENYGFNVISKQKSKLIGKNGNQEFILLLEQK